MTDNLRFTELIEEFRRVGVDPDTFSAVLAVTPADALRVLHTLPDGAGPEAFLHGLRSGRAQQVPPPDPPRPSDDVRHSA